MKDERTTDNLKFKLKDEVVTINAGPYTAYKNTMKGVVIDINLQDKDENHDKYSYAKPFFVELDNGEKVWMSDDEIKLAPETLTAKEAICAWLDGQDVEVKICNAWFDFECNPTVLKNKYHIYRIKPKPKKQYKVFGVLFDEDELPLKSLDNVSNYWTCGLDGEVFNTSEIDNDYSENKLKFKSAFLTKEACEKWYKALAEYDLTSCVVEG